MKITVFFRYVIRKPQIHVAIFLTICFLTILPNALSFPTGMETLSSFVFATDPNTG